MLDLETRIIGAMKDGRLHHVRVIADTTGIPIGEVYRQLGFLKKGDRARNDPRGYWRLTTPVPAFDGQLLRLPIGAIRTDLGTQSRKATNPATIDEYAGLMRGGVEFEPVTVFYTPDAEFVLSRGFHRLPAAIKAGRGDIDVIIRIGDLAAAKWDSAGSNKHGLRCTPEDYRAAVALALAARPTATNLDVARHIGITDKTVAKYRVEAAASSCRIGKDGKSYPPNRSRKSKRAAKVPGHLIDPAIYKVQDFVASLHRLGLDGLDTKDPSDFLADLSVDIGGLARDVRESRTSRPEHVERAMMAAASLLRWANRHGETVRATD